MTAPAAIRGTFSDFKIIRGRKCAQLVIEVPLEEADAALQALGGIPNPVNEAWVAIARLDLSKAQEPAKQLEPPAKERRRFSELPPAQQAALKCSSPAFWRFITEHSGSRLSYEEDEAAAYVRGFCNVKSRADLNTNPEAAERWLKLLCEFDVWLMDVVPA